jgi:hypothetical protein
MDAVYPAGAHACCVRDAPRGLTARQYGNRTKLVSPAVTNGGGKTGLAWLDAFFAACGKCQIDAVAIHIYDSATNVQYFKNYISAGALRRQSPVYDL